MPRYSTTGDGDDERKHGRKDSVRRRRVCCFPCLPSFLLHRCGKWPSGPNRTRMDSSAPCRLWTMHAQQYACRADRFPHIRPVPPRGKCNHDASTPFTGMQIQNARSALEWMRTHTTPRRTSLIQLHADVFYLKPGNTASLFDTVFRAFLSIQRACIFISFCSSCDFDRC